MAGSKLILAPPEYLNQPALRKVSVAILFARFFQTHHPT
jgi:hypothetical protein